jgi:hypothetical protein
MEKREEKGDWLNNNVNVCNTTELTLESDFKMVSSSICAAITKYLRQSNLNRTQICLPTVLKVRKT